MMRFRLRLLRNCLFVLLVGWSLKASAQGTGVQLEIFSQPAIDFIAEQSSFVLGFSDFKKGASTNTVDVTYSVMANDVVKTEDVVLARLDDLFPNVAFRAQFGSYAPRGGDATLVAAQSGWVTVGTSDVGLARKDGGKMLDGTFIITYQAQALEDQPAGEEIRTLTVTFAPT